MNNEQFALDTARAVTRYISTPEGRIAFDDWRSEKAYIADLEHWLREMRNDLCDKCGRYRRAYDGGCDGCRWKEMPI